MIRFDLLIKVKNLGKRVVIVRRLRIFVIVVVIVSMFGLLCITILSLAGVAPESIEIINFVSRIAVLLLAIGLDLYLLIDVARWVASMDQERRQHRRVRQLVTKNWWLGVNLVVIGLAPTQILILRFFFDLSLSGIFFCALYFHNYIIRLI